MTLDFSLLVPVGDTTFTADYSLFSISGGSKLLKKQRNALPAGLPESVSPWLTAPSTQSPCTGQWENSCRCSRNPGRTWGLFQRLKGEWRKYLEARLSTSCRDCKETSLWKSESCYQYYSGFLSLVRFQSYQEIVFHYDLRVLTAFPV